MGADVVINIDGFNEVVQLIEGSREEVTELAGPRHYPQYNGKKERSMRDIKSFERALRRDGTNSSLCHRIDAGMYDLNEVRPRPVLGGKTAREALPGTCRQHRG